LDRTPIYTSIDEMPNGKTCYIILLKNNAVTATEVRYTEKEPKQKADILKDEVQND
jgi:hypothetical protein